MASPLASPLDPAASSVMAPPAKTQQQVDQTYFQQANAALKLSPQEQQLYQMHLDNLYGSGGVDNPDGSRSTLYQTTVEMDGRTYVIPTVWSGKIVPPEQAAQLAQQYGMDKFPAYSSQQEAEARYQQMHGYMERDTADYLKQRKR